MTCCYYMAEGWSTAPTESCHLLQTAYSASLCILALMQENQMKAGKILARFENSQTYFRTTCTLPSSSCESHNSYGSITFGNYYYSQYIGDEYMKLREE